MVSAGISFEGKEGLHFLDEKAKVNADYYVNQLMSKSVGDCHQLLGEKFIFSTRWIASACGKSDSAVACSSLSTLY